MATSHAVAVCDSLSAVQKETGTNECEQLVRNHSLHLGRVGRRNEGVLIEMALALGLLRGQDMAGERAAALDLAGCGLAEALGCAFMSF
jgi:hypothetical protein